MPSSGTVGTVGSAARSVIIGLGLAGTVAANAVGGGCDYRETR